MKTMPGLFSLLVGTMLLGAGAGPKPEPSVRNVAVTRVVHIPVTVGGPQGNPEPAGRVETSLLISPGASDELPEGPEGFDLLNDGTLLIADPLRNRLAAFDSQGAFRQEWRIGFAADSVAATPGGLIFVREASTGTLHAFDGSGRQRPAEAVPSPPQAREARLLTPYHGIVLRSPPGRAPLDVTFDRPGFRLLSLEDLGSDEAGDSYVALEATAGGEAVEVSKIVRRYNSQGQLVAEITDMRVDYYVPPVDEIRVHQGFVYQLMSTESEIAINVWDTN
jgi:hypothetical protein